MDRIKIFEILGIEETNDKEQLRQAYRAQLVHHHPEDDPEGFKALRTAYEEAMNLADILETEQERKDGGEGLHAVCVGIDAGKAHIGLTVQHIPFRF